MALSCLRCVKPMKMSNEEQLKLLTKYSLEAVCGRIAGEIPAEGSFKPVILQFDIPGTSDWAQIVVVHHAGSPVRERSLQLRAGQMRDDWQYTCFLESGTNGELCDYLKREGIVEEWAGYIKDLCEKIKRRADQE